MALTEQHRRSIHESLEAVHGPEIANHLMELLPRQPEAQLVTRTDMHANTIMLRGEMAELRAELRAEMAELRADVRTELAGLQKWAAGILASNGVALTVALLT